MNVFYEAASILIEGTSDKIDDALLLLEDATSPITQKYKEKLYQSIIDRSHVDFGDIPNSKGDILKYSGYKSMTETLNILEKLGRDEKCEQLVTYSKIVNDAIGYIIRMKNYFMKGFVEKNKYVILDYNLYTFTCVEATTSLISAFVSDLQTQTANMKITLQDTKYRADLFFIKTLSEFNSMNKNGTYEKHIKSMLVREDMSKFKRSGFDPGTMIGIGAVAIFSLAIIPITRKIIYCIKDGRQKLSDALAQQAYFLELNKNCIEFNETIDSKKKTKILKKQEKVRKLLLSLSEKLKVANARAVVEAEKKIEKDNRTMTIDGIQNEINDSDITIM